jgi:hypothetical protein
MKQTNQILSLEWRKFRAGELGQFILYAVIMLIWSASFGTMQNQDKSWLSIAWWLFFSVVITATFSSSVFVSERVAGSLEILLTSGISRRAILYGKTLFCVGMSLLIGYACFGLSMVWQFIRIQSEAAPFEQPPPEALALFLAAAFFNTMFGAWMTIKLASPRMLYLLNMLVVAVIFTIYYMLLMQTSLPVNVWWLIGMVLLLGGALVPLVEHEFNSERVIKPVTF